MINAIIILRYRSSGYIGGLLAEDFSHGNDLQRMCGSRIVMANWTTSPDLD